MNEDSQQEIPSPFTAVIPAAGSSSRMRGIDKLATELDGMPVVARTLQAFQKFPACASIVIVTRKTTISWYEELTRSFSFDKVHHIIEGGARRQDSVLNGLRNVDTELVAIHDGARPLISTSLLLKLYKTAIHHDGCIPVMPVKDTIKRVDNKGYVIETPPREELYMVQTPQFFKTRLLLESYDRLKESGRSVTDDASLMELAGYRIRTLPGEAENIKITTAEDIEIARTFLKCGKPDVHVPMHKEK